MRKLLGACCAIVMSWGLVTPATAWTIIQNFDDKADGVSCGWSAGSGSTVSSTQHYSGNNSCRLTISANDTGWGRWGGVIQHSSSVKRGEELWLRVRTFMPVGFNYDSIAEGNKLKFLRFHTRSAANTNLGYDDWYINPKGSLNAFQFIYEGEQVWEVLSGLWGITNLLSSKTDEQIQLGRWETYEMYVKFDTVPAAKGGMAYVRTWKNGVLLKESGNRVTLATTDAYSDRTHLFTYWNGGSPATQSMYVDDVVLTTDRPASKDANGHPYIGMGEATTPQSPKLMEVR